MSAQKKPSVLIAGGSSFLSSKLTSALLSQNCKVTVIDDFDETPESLKSFLDSPDFKFEKIDITRQLPANLGEFTQVYHLAGLAEYLLGAALTHKDLLNNSAGTENLLKLTKELGARLILVSTLDVYAGVISQTSLENYFGPTQVDFSHHSHYEAKRFAESLTAVYFQNYGTDCAIARVTQVYGPGMDLTSQDVISKLVNQALESDSVIIEEDSLEVLHPTFVDGVIWGLVKIGFSKNSRGGIYNLVTPSEVTVLEFVNKLKEATFNVLGKTLEASFAARPKSIKFPISKVELTKTEQVLGWEPQIELSAGLAKTLEFFAKAEKEERELERIETKVFQPEKKYPPSISLTLPKFALPNIPSLKLPNLFRVKFMTLFLFIVLALLFFPVGQIFYGVVFSVKNFHDVKTQLLATNFEKAEVESKQGEAAAVTALSGFKKSKPVFLIFGQSKSYERLQQNFEGIRLAFAGSENLTKAAKLASALARTSLTAAEDNLGEKISQLDLELTTTISDFETAGIFLEGSSFEKLPFVGDKIKTARGELSQNLPNLKKASNFVKLLPQLVAIDGQKSYLVLFLNNSELRPGGGFVGSYSVFNFENGKFLPPVVDDIYNLDGQLKVKIPPPEALKIHLGVENLGLRDSNWHYDFAQNAIVATSIYQDVTGKTVDGVVAIDVEAFAALLKVLGTINLADYDEEITAENLAERTEYYSEINFFPGSTSKKDFLGAAARQVLLSLQEGRGVNYFEMAKAFAKAADEKHLSFYFQNPNLANFVKDFGWSGETAQISEKSNGQVKITTDFLALSEANVGANKANRFLEKEIKVAPIILRDGDLITSVEINFVNKSPAPTWPGGNYKNYLRIITPQGTKLEQFKIGAEDVTTRVEQLAEGDKQIFAVFFEVLAGSEKKIVIAYRPNYRIEVAGNLATYSLLIQKQPGTKADNVSLDLSYPGYLKAVKSSLPADFSEQKVVAGAKLSTDLNFVVDFSL